MAFNGVNGILGTGGGKSASWGKQGRYQDLVCPDQEKEKAGGPFLQKIDHYFLSSLYQAFPVKNIVRDFSHRARNGAFLQKSLTSVLEQMIHSPCDLRRIFQAETFPYRYNYIHKRQLTSL